jgi:hypothetical protein
MDITLQYFDGCPNWKITDADVSRLIDELGVEAQVSYQLIDTPEAAAEAGFRGSPTVLIDGIDPWADPEAPAGLSCRVYMTDAGPTGSPATEDLTAALRAASKEGR